MKQLSFILLIGFCIGCGTSKTNMNGTWIPVKEEMNGMQLPDSSFSKQSLVMNDSNYIFTAESVDKGVSRTNGDKMDIYGREGVNAGKHFTAIYKMEKDQLWICYNLKGDTYPTSYDTKGQEMNFCCVFKKEK